MMDFLVKPALAWTDPPTISQAGAGVNAKANLPKFLAFMSGDANTAVSKVWGWFITIIFVVAAIFVFYNLVMGALKWIQSGGEKEKVEKARNQITTAVIGLVVLFLVILVVVVIELIFGIGLGITMNITLPKFGETI